MASFPVSPLWEREPGMKDTENSTGVLPVCVAGHRAKECRRKELPSGLSSSPTSSLFGRPMEFVLKDLHRRLLRKSPRKKCQIGREGYFLFAALEFLNRNPREKTEECKDYTLQVRLLHVLQPAARAISLKRRR